MKISILTIFRAVSKLNHHEKIFFNSDNIVISFNSFPQTIKYGIKAGPNISNLNGYYNGAAEGSLTNFAAGGLANIFVSNIFFIEPELLFSGKANNTAKLYYVEIPVDIMLKEPFESSDLYFGLGPYLGIGIAGNIQKFNYYNNEPVNTFSKIKFGNSANDDFKKIDFGLNLKTGIQLDMGAFVSLNYSLGLTDITPSVATAKNRYLGISVGFMFGNHMK